MLPRLALTSSIGMPATADRPASKAGADLGAGAIEPTPCPAMVGPASSGGFSSGGAASASAAVASISVVGASASAAGGGTAAAGHPWTSAGGVVCHALVKPEGVSAGAGGAAAGGGPP